MIQVSRNETKENQWLQLLEEALEENVVIRPNYRFTYKDKNLGSFLYRAEKKNNTVLLEKINALGFDYKKIRRQNSIRNKKHNQWLLLLKEAISEGVKMQVNHRFNYKGKNLGTFLVAAKENKTLVRKIKKIGLDFDDYIRKPQLYAERFLKDLQNCDASKKPRFINRFYRYVLPKKEHLKEETIDEINIAWKNKFGDRRVWRFPMIEEQRIVLWKRFRYDEELNPEGKWLLSAERMGKKFNFAYRRKKNVYLMKKAEKHFTKKEIEELKSEGYFDEKYLIQQPT